MSFKRMVLPPRIELGIQPYHGCVMPFNYGSERLIFFSVFIISNPVGKCKIFVTVFQKNGKKAKKSLNIANFLFRYRRDGVK